MTAPMIAAPIPLPVSFGTTTAAATPTTMWAAVLGGPPGVSGVGPAGRVAEVAHEGAPGLAERHPFLAPVHPDGDRDPGEAADVVARPVVQQGQQQVPLVSGVEGRDGAVPFACGPLLRLVEQPVLGPVADEPRRDLVACGAAVADQVADRARLGDEVHALEITRNWRSFNGTGHNPAGDTDMETS